MQAGAHLGLAPQTTLPPLPSRRGSASIAKDETLSHHPYITLRADVLVFLLGRPAGKPGMHAPRTGYPVARDQNHAPRAGCPPKGLLRRPPPPNVPRPSPKARQSPSQTTPFPTPPPPVPASAQVAKKFELPAGTVFSPGTLPPAGSV